MNLTIFLPSSKGIYLFCLKKGSLNEIFISYDAINSNSCTKDSIRFIKACAHSKLIMVYDDLRPGSDNGLVSMNKDFINSSVLKLISDHKIPFEDISGEYDLSRIICSKLIELFNFFPDDRVIYFHEKAVFLIENHSVQKVLVHSKGLAAALLLKFHPDLIISDKSVAQEIIAEFSASEHPPKIKLLTTQKRFNSESEQYVPYLPFITGTSIKAEENRHFSELKKILRKQTLASRYIRYTSLVLIISLIFLIMEYYSYLSVTENNSEASVALSESENLKTLYPWLKNKNITPAEYTDSLNSITPVTETAAHLKEFVTALAEFDSTWINSLSYSGGIFFPEGYTVSRDNIFRMTDKISDFRISKIRTLRFEGSEFFLFSGEF